MIKQEEVETISSCLVNRWIEHISKVTGHASEPELQMSDLVARSQTVFYFSAKFRSLSSFASS